MNNPLGVSPSKGNQVTKRGKEKIFDLGGNRTHDLRIRSTITLPTELRGRTEKVGDDYFHLDNNDRPSKNRHHQNKRTSRRKGAFLWGYLDQDQ